MDIAHSELTGHYDLTEGRKRVDITELILEHDEKVKAEAFDEFVSKYKEFINLVCIKSEFCYGECIDCFAKWYKEQKNE